MPRKKSEQITGRYESADVVVARRSDAHREDVLCNTKQICRLVDITQPRAAELLLLADAEVMGNKGPTKLYWQAETLSRVARHWAPPKLRKGEKQKDKPSKSKDEPGPLEQRRIRVLDIKIAKDEEDWIPVDVAVYALSQFLQEARSIFTSCVPLLRRKYANKIPTDMYQHIDDHMTETYNMSLDLDFSVGEIDYEEPVDV